MDWVEVPLVNNLVIYTSEGKIKVLCKGKIKEFEELTQHIWVQTHFNLSV